MVHPEFTKPLVKARQKNKLGAFRVQCKFSELLVEVEFGVDDYAFL
jgi:hypothetical protein